MIPVFRPSYDGREAQAVAEVLASGWVGLGPRTQEFERAFAAFAGTRFAVSTNSCTAALQVALHLVGVGKGDEVLVPTITFASTAHAAVYLGGRPVFCDVDPDTLCLDYADARRRRGPRTRAVVPMLYGGVPVAEPDLGVPAVYDCAHGCGSAFGAAGKLCCWSFHAVKNLACGEGGMITTDDAEEAERARKLRWMGIDRSTWERASGGRGYSWDYDIPAIGYKAHGNDVHAAIGLVQLAKLPGMQARRRALAARYHARLSGLVAAPPPDDRSSWHLYVIRTPRRDGLAEYLTRRGVSTGVHYRPLHTHRCYGDGFQRPHLPVAEEQFRQILTLPLFPDLTDGQVDHICDLIEEFHRGCAEPPPG